MFKEENLKKTFIILMMLYPLFGIKFFYNSYFTLIQIGLIMILFIWLLAINKSSRKNIKWLILYEVLLIGYAILHHMNALNFTSLVPGNFNYSALKEILYLIKLNIPIIFVYILFYLKLNKTEFIKIIKWWIILISGSIVVTNILCISLGSYSDELIKGNIFTWFNQDLNISYYDLASKGFFVHANQISTLMILLLVMIFNVFINETNNKSLIFIILLLLSMIMIGTRVASIGGLLVIIVLLISYIFLSFIKKEKIKIFKILYLIIIMIFFSFLLFFSPCINRKVVIGGIQENIIFDKTKNKIKVNNNHDLIEKDKIEYIKNNYEEKRVHSLFITKSYPYQYDPDFWMEILSLNVDKRIDFRFLEIEMVKRVVNINNNKFDVFFGITNSRVQNIFNIERDFVLQYYAFGIFGSILFLSVYFLLLLKISLCSIKNFCFNNICIFSITVLFLACSFVSGNNLNFLIATIPFLFLYTCNFEKNDTK